MQPGPAPPASGSPASSGPSSSRRRKLLAGHPGSCLGAAYVAGVAIGALPGWGEMGRFVRPARTVEPDPAAAAVYGEACAAYRALYATLKAFYPRLARFGG